MSRMSLDTAIRLSAEVKGGGAIDRVKRSLQDLGKSAQVTSREHSALHSATVALARVNNQTVNGIRNSITAFRGLQEQARIGGAEFRKYGDEIARLEARLKSLDQTSNRTALVAGLAGGVAGAIAVQAANVAGQGARGIVSVGLDAETAQVRLRALSNEFGEYNKAQAATTRIAQTLRLTTIEAENAFASLYASLRPTGVTVEEIEKAFIGFTAAVRNSGATAQESAAAMIQLRQALASGVLQGEELRSIREQAPLVAQAIAQEMGVTIGKLKDLGAEGKITTDVVLRALARLNDTQLGKLNEQFNTGRQAIKDFQNEATNLGTQLARIFGPSAVSLLRGFTAALRDAANVMGALSNNAQSLENVRMQQRASDQAAAEANQQFGVFSFDQGGKASFFQRRQREILQQLQRERAATLPAPVQLTGAQTAAQQAAADQRAQQAAARVGATGGGGGGGRAAGGESTFQPSSRARALIAAAQKLGVSPLDLATIISFETAGTFSPSKWGGAGGNYMGLIQFGAPERRQYGANANQSFEEQVTGPVVRYFQDRFKGVGMSTQGASLEDLYTTVLAGNPRANRNSRDSFGTSPRSGVAAMGPHRQKALQMFFGGSMANVGFGAIEQAEASNAGFEAQEQAAEQLAQKQAEANKRLEEFVEARTKSITELNKETELLQATTEIDRKRLEYAFERNEIIDKAKQQETDLLAIQEKLKQLGIDQNIDEMKARIETEKNHALLILQKREEQEINDLIAERVRMMQALTLEVMAPSAYNPLEQQKADLDALLQKYPMVGAAADQAAELASRGFADMVTGARSAKEVFADFLKGMADALIQTAKTMIAQYIAIGIAKMFAGFGGGMGFSPSAAGPFGAGGLSAGLSFTPGFTGFANGGVMSPSGPMPLRTYSRGGIANSPQVAVFGEGMMNEAYVPLPDGRRIPVAMQMRDDVGRDRMRELMGASPAGNGSPVLNMSFETGYDPINKVEYVSVQQLKAAMQETRKHAASDGAKRGMSMTLDRLQQSPSTRSRVGIR